MIRTSIFLSLAAILTACSDSTPVTDLSDLESRSSGASEDIATRAVRIGFDGPRFDACASYGRVSNLNPSGENYLSVRAAPAGSASEIDRLQAGTRISMCQKVGDWFGVVYPPPSEEPIDCGTGSPVSTVRAYEGPCLSGWVNENYVKLVAG